MTPPFRAYLDRAQRLTQPAAFFAALDTLGLDPQTAARLLRTRPQRLDAWRTRPLVPQAHAAILALLLDLNAPNPTSPPPLTRVPPEPARPLREPPENPPPSEPGP